MYKQFASVLFVAVISGFLGGALSLWFLMPPSVLAQDEPQKVIEAQEFRVVDSGGATRATLGVFEDVPIFALLDQRGEARIMAGLDEDEPRLNFLDQNQNPRVQIGLLDNEPTIDLVDERGTSRAAITLSDNEASFYVSDQEGEPRIMLGNVSVLSMKIAPAPTLIIYDEDGNVAWEAPAESPQKVVTAEKFEVVDQNGTTRAELGVSGLEVGLTLYGPEFGQSLDPFPFARFYLQPGAAGINIEGDKGAAVTIGAIGEQAFISLDEKIIDDSALLSPSGLQLIEDTITKAAFGKIADLLGETLSVRQPWSLVLFDEEGDVVWSAP